MGNSYSTYFLVQNGSNVPECEFVTFNLTPGSNLPSQSLDKNVLMAGGFSSIIAEKGVPLSPTLQLNFDLTNLTHEEITSIAKAELNRFNAVEYSSYTVEADNRVCVIADSPQQLQTFIDTYGGILEIEPLLTQGDSLETQAATEISIINHGQSCRLEYQIHSPINKTLCTYCGKCGPICPEKCLTERLFVNYDLCTYCKECEKVCEARAIDIHGVADRTLKVPAVIVLASARVELPSGLQNVYSEETLPLYFATLFPCQIDEIVTCDNSICQYSGNLGSGCGYCLSSCPHGAIIQDENGVQVDAIKCLECGACVAACPTGALQNQRFTDASFFEYFKNISIPQNCTVVIGQEESLHQLWWQRKGDSYPNTLFLQYDMVDGLSLFHFLYLFSRGAKRIALLQKSDQDTTLSASLKQIGLATEILGKLYDSEHPIVKCKIEDFEDLMTLPQVAPLSFMQHDNTFINRRHTLALILQEFVKESGREITLRPETYIPFATISCDTEKCTQCLACLGECRIEAMKADEKELSLNLHRAMCICCGICVIRCPEKALTLSRECTLNNDFFISTQLAQAEPMECSNCGKVFGTKKSFERVMSILASKESVDISHFKMCDSCRVVKLFEEQNA